MSACLRGLTCFVPDFWQLPDRSGPTLSPASRILQSQPEGGLMTNRFVLLQALLVTALSALSESARAEVAEGNTG